MKKSPFKKWNSYKEFLESGDWQKIRKKILQRDQYKCQFCGGKATQVHHVRYTTRIFHLEKLENMKAICRKCHDNIHQKEKQELQRKMQELREKKEERPTIHKSVFEEVDNLLSRILKKLKIINENIEKLNDIDQKKVQFLNTITYRNNEGSWPIILNYLQKIEKEIEKN